MVISRTIEGESWTKGRSRCDHCKHVLNWFDMIPVLSYLVLRGRCRYCMKKISPQHPIIEIMVGMLFMWWGVMGAVFFQLVQSPLTILQPGYWLGVGLILVGVFFADYYYGIIPETFVVSGVVLSLIYRGVLVLSGAMMSRDFIYSLFAAMGAWSFMYFLHMVTKGKGMGMGDVKYSILMGLILGWPRIIPGMLVSFVLGAVVGVSLIFKGKKKLGQTIPFGPFLVIGTMIGLIWGEALFKFMGY